MRPELACRQNCHTREPAGAEAALVGWRVRSATCNALSIMLKAGFANNFADVASSRSRQDRRSPAEKRGIRTICNTA